MKLGICSIVLIFGLLSLGGCSADSEYEPPETGLQEPAPTVEIRTGPEVHGGVLAEFARRGGGECVLTRAESSVDGIFHFEWESPKDHGWIRGEVMAAVMSVLRGYDGYVGGFEIVRTDAEGKDHITIAGADYNAWLDGKINDPTFLEKCGLSD